MKALSGLSAAVALCVAGCGSTGTVEDEGMLENEGSELSASAKLMGSYQATQGTLLGLVLAKDGNKRVFAADQQVWCIKAPCYPIHLTGTWSVRLGKLYLTENGNKHIYKYDLSGDVLTLSDPASGQVTGTLQTVDTWCGTTADCDLQQWIHPMCVGGPVCTAGQRCGWSCGAMPLPGGYGDDCSAGQACFRGLTCDGGQCRPAASCDLYADMSCGEALVCTATEETSVCMPFEHAVSVGRGYACGGSIGVDCAAGLTCEGLPEGKIGGTGTCQ